MSESLEHMAESLSARLDAALFITLRRFVHLDVEGGVSWSHRFAFLLRVLHIRFTARVRL